MLVFKLNFIILMIYKLIVTAGLFVFTQYLFAQEIEGIQLGERDQKSTFTQINDQLFQVMPIEDEETNVTCGVMYQPVNEDSQIPTTLTKSNISSFEKEITKEYDIKFDSVLHYGDTSMKFFIHKETGVEYELSREKIGDEYDIFFVVWYEKLSSPQNLVK